MCSSVLEKGLFKKALSPFVIGLLRGVVIELQEFLIYFGLFSYINTLLDMWFVSIFYHTLAYLFILLIVSLVARKILASCSATYLFLLLFIVLWYHIQEIIAKINVIKLFPYVCFQEFDGFRSYT